MKINHSMGSAIRKVNIWDEVIYSEDRGKTIKDGVVIGITMRGVHIFRKDPNFFGFVKWSNVREILKKEVYTYSFPYGK